jgi:curved DNA-binding protein CbpA
MDPYAVLGVAPGTPESEIAAAYREQAKRWHPDRAGAGGEARMAEINEAYDVLRASAQHGPRPKGASPPRSAGGGWLADAVRRALGPELLRALSAGETVRLVTPAATWASPRAILALTDRRLLWLLDDAPVARVRSLPLRDVGRVERRTRRKRASLTVHTLSGRRYAFHELRPHTADTIERHLTPARPG